jgi:hypothetical protein
MRLNDLSGGSIKTLLILILILANIAVALAHHRVLPQPPGSAGASPALFGAPPKSSWSARRVSREARDTAGEAPAFPHQP